MENDHSQCFFTERRTASEQGQGHHLQGEKSNIKFYEHVTMTSLLTSGSNHTIHTAFHRRGGANQTDHRPHPTGGRGDKAEQDHPRRQKTTHLTGKGGVPWGGAGRAGVQHPASYMWYLGFSQLQHLVFFRR